MITTLHDTDFSLWTLEQTKFLKRKEFHNLDIDNLIEEVESLGNSEKRALESYIEIWLLHMLKVMYQPEKHTRSWDVSIKIHKYKAQKTLLKNPSLKPELKEIIDDAYFSARLLASDETGIDENVFPRVSPWSAMELFPELPKKYVK
jgi:hypothetical protein